MGLCTGQHIGDASPQTIKSKEKNCSTIAALLESAILSGEIIPRGYPLTKSGSSYPAISTGSECSDLVLWACFHQPSGAGHVINERAIARKQRNRSKKMFAKENSPALDKCPPSNIPGIASNKTGNVDK